MRPIDSKHNISCPMTDLLDIFKEKQTRMKQIQDLLLGVGTLMVSLNNTPCIPIQNNYSEMIPWVYCYCAPKK